MAEARTSPRRTRATTACRYIAAAGIPGVDRYDVAVAVRLSAGILLFRRGPGSTGSTDSIEVLLAHPGGPFFTTRDLGHWSIPKGEPDDGEADLLEVAKREFAEEVGSAPPPAGPDGEPPLNLGTIVQKGGKVVHAWAIEGDLDPANAISNTFDMEWPPRSGRHQDFPEIDRVTWFTPAEARVRLKPTQIPFVDRLIEALEGNAVDGSSAARAAAANPDAG
jgi:predicted NUDIX family NTP pyrophosphohydrolase